MANNNVQNVRFLRNGTLFESREAARTALSGQTLTTEKDGSAILARYGSGNAVKTLVGWVFYAANDSKSITIFDIDDIGTDVQQAIDAINAKIGDGFTSTNTIASNLVALSGTSSDTSGVTSVEGAKRYADGLKEAMDYTGVTTGDGVYVTNVTQSDGIIAATTATLPSKSSVSGESKVIIDVTENKGEITAYPANLSGVKLDGYQEATTTGDVASTDTLGEALGKLQKTIHEMDKIASAEDGKVVTTISETNGVVDETKANVKDLQLGGYAKGEQAGPISGTDTINVALSKIENNIDASKSATTVNNTDHSINVSTAATGTTIGVNIKSGEKVISLGNEGIYTNIKLSAVTVSEANVKEAFALVASDGTTQLGSTIKIYKDSSLLSVALLHANTTANPQVLPTYDKATDSWTDIASPTEANQALCFAYENVEGTVVVAAVPVGSFINEQEFASGLTWDATAGKVKGVVDGSSESFLTVGEDGFKLAGVQNAINTAVNALDVTGDTAQSGKYITHINEENGLIIIGGREDISKAPLNDYAKGSSSNAVLSSDSINAAISKLENQVDTAKSAATTVVAEGTDAGNNMSIVETSGADSHKIFTVNLTDVASAQGLASEIAARKAVDGQSGQTYAQNTSSPYISGASDLNDADVKLAAALKSLSDETVNQVKVNNVALTETSNAVNVQISATAGTGAEDTPITVVTDNSTGAVTLKLEGIDCGTY